MLLDQISPMTSTELVETVKKLLDHTATGEECIPLERMAESQVAIALELISLIDASHSPSMAWKAIIRILRLLPWNIDPELSKYPSLYRYFGGLEHASYHDEKLFNSLVTMQASNQCWQSTINYVIDNIKVNNFLPS